MILQYFTIFIPANAQYFDAKICNYNHAANLPLSAIIRDVLKKWLNKAEKYRRLAV
jgi:hypothetical protein